MSTQGSLCPRTGKKQDLLVHQAGRETHSRRSRGRHRTNLGCKDRDSSVEWRVGKGPKEGCRHQSRTRTGLSPQELLSKSLPSRWLNPMKQHTRTQMGQKSVRSLPVWCLSSAPPGPGGEKVGRLALTMAYASSCSTDVPQNQEWTVSLEWLERARWMEQPSPWPPAQSIGVALGGTSTSWLLQETA